MIRRILSLGVCGLVIVAMTLSFSLEGLARQGENILYSQNFDSGEAPEWNLENGWEIVPSEAGYALKGVGHVWASLWDGPWEDYFLRFRLNREGSDSAIHANIRVIGPVRYFIGFNRDGSYLSKQTGEQTFKEGLASGPPIGRGWKEIEISAAGGQITVSVNGQKWMRYSDPEPLVSGGVAFESLGGQAVWIDDVVVGEYTSGVTPQPTRAAGGAQPPQASDLRWIYTGGPLGGLGYDVRMRPDNPDVMFVTDARSGAFRSQDGGKTWQAANNGITTRIGETGELIPVFCLTIDPHNPEIIWAGTHLQTGVFKSLDGGNSWKKMGHGITEQGLTLRGFTVDPRTSDIVYTAGEVGSWEWSGQVLTGHEFDLVKGVVYKTTDGGNNWKKIWEGDNLARYIWIDPRNPDVLYVSTGIFDREAANSDYAAGKPGGVGILKSLDGGQTWQPMNNGLQNLYIGSLFMHPTNPDILMAGAGVVTYPQGSGVYLTTDGGVSWQKTLDAYTIGSVEIASSDPNIAYAGNVDEFYRSEDGGQTWRMLSTPGIRWGPRGVSVGTPIDFQVDPRNPRRVFVDAYGGGNFVSEDGGETWQTASKGYSGAMVRDIAVDARGAGGVYAASRVGIFASHNGGEDWTGLAYPPFQENDWHAVSVNPAEPDQILAGLTCHRVAVFSADGGASWKEVLELSGNVAFRTFVFAPSNPKVVYAGTTGFLSCGSFDPAFPGLGVYASQDGGRTWARANDASMQEASIAQLAVHPQDERIIFAATYNLGLVTTADGGLTWQPVAPDLFQGKSTTTIAFSPSNPNLLFAGRYFGGLLSSQDGGATWKPSNAGLNPEATVTDIVFDPQNPQVVYISDLFSGVYRSVDGGKSWRAIHKGLDLRAINALALTSDGQHLYAASEGRGVFRLDINGQPPEAMLLPTPTPLPPPTLAPVEAPTAVTGQAAAPPAAPTTAPLPPVTAAPPPSGSFSLPCGSSLALMGLALTGWVGRRRRKPGKRI